MISEHWSKGWYYKIELEKGNFSDGISRPTLALARKLLRNVDVHEKDCLDIGTTEAVIPVLLKRNGARSVMGYDKVDSSQKIELIKNVYNTDFEYRHSLLLPQFQESLDGRFFDLVVFSGVFYHLVNPMGLLSLVRGFCKVGGLFLFETCTVHDSEEKMVFGSRGWFGENYFFATTAFLDYVLRMIGLEPINVVYANPLSPNKVSRTSILCRSHPMAMPLEENDTFMPRQFQVFADKSFNEAIRYNLSDLLQTKSDIEVLPYTDKRVGAVNGRKLYDVINELPPYHASEDEMCLRLDATM